MRYLALVDRDPGQDWSLVVPDCAGCATQAPTFEAAIDAGVEALRDWVEVAREMGHAVPAPRDPARLREDAEIAAALARGAALVSLPVLARSGQSVRINASVDAAHLDAIDEAAARAGMSRSAFMVAASLKAVSAQS